MKEYNHKKIEPKWQKEWAKKKIYKTEEVSDKPKSFVLDMFPYPSGEGLHVGHPKGYIATDIYSRFKKMSGFNVLHPMGWDAFGLPAENYAIKNKIHPRIAVEKNIIRYKEQLSIIGPNYDWSREINTTDPKYYKWTQWAFLKMLEKGLAFQSFEPINWCPSCQTGLAAEDLEDGKCERCGSVVEKKPMRQWVLKITDYAERLLADLEPLNWPESIKESQKNWIGKSEGAEIGFPVEFSKSREIQKFDQSTKDKKLEEILETLINLSNENKKRLVISGGWGVDVYADKRIRNHDDVDVNVLHSETGWWKEQLEKNGFTQIKPEDSKKDPRYHLNFVKKVDGEDCKIDIIGIGFDDSGVIYDMEWGKPDSWKFPSENIIKAKFQGKSVEIFSAPVQLWLKIYDREKDRLDRSFLESKSGKIAVFTTRPETIFGATALVLSPEHTWVTLALDEKHKGVLNNADEVRAYVKAVAQKTEIDRTNARLEKTGVKFDGVWAVNPATKEKIPVFVADYVLAGHGTGAVMSVPAHDERDFVFAKKFGLEIKQVIAPFFIDHENPPVEGKELSPRRNVQAVVKHPTEDKIIQIQWKKVPWRSLVIGGAEGDELYEDAVRREVTEETGYKNFKKIEKLGWQMESRYYAKHKDINRQAFSQVFVVELADLEKNELGKEESEIHTVAWVPASEITKTFWPISELPEIAAHLERGPHAFVGHGKIINSDVFNGKNSDDSSVQAEILKLVGGKKVTKYKLRDWVFSRQRYWGEPIPVIHCAACGVVPVPEKDLPVKLPEVKNYAPTGTGESPLAAIEKWVNVKCPKCRGKAKRETNTMPQWAGSCWYYLRYMDSKNSKQLVDPKIEKYWAPVDVYVGGAEHATRHLIYARFWHKFLHDIGVVSTSEPFSRLHNVGLILAEDGRKMSKRFGNVINPDEIVGLYGADTFRLHEMFMGPFDQSSAWDTKSIIGSRRFIERIWRLVEKVDLKADSKSPELKKQIDVDPKFESLLHSTISKVSTDIENFGFNTAISSLMILSKEFENQTTISRTNFETLLQLVAPFAPHVTDELWTMLGNKKSIHVSDWPKADPSKMTKSVIKMMIQVNGKIRGELDIEPDSSEEVVKKMAFELENVKKWLNQATVERVVFVKNRLLNIVVR